MPNPIWANLWSCNIWEREVDRETAADMNLLNQINWAEPGPGDVSSIPLGPDGERISQAAWERHQALTDEWPEVPPIIDASLHVDGNQDDKVRTYRNSKTDDPAVHAKKLECYDRADYQLDRAGYGTTDPPYRDARNWQMVTEVVTADGVVDSIDVGATAGAVEYLKEVLPTGRPALVGIRLNYWSERPNDRAATPGIIEPTNHFVVIVGAGTDDKGHYFSYYDYLAAPSDSERFYLRSNMALTTHDEGYQLIRVHRSWKKRQVTTE